eukprot:8487065-Pyramimonas_sp.AAC.1
MDIDDIDPFDDLDANLISTDSDILMPEDVDGTWDTPEARDTTGTHSGNICGQREEQGESVVKVPSLHLAPPQSVVSTTQRAVNTDETMHDPNSATTNSSDRLKETQRATSQTMEQRIADKAAGVDTAIMDDTWE